MGDSLKAASRFVSQSMDSLDHLMTADPFNHVSAIDQLSTLQSGAKAMRARSIYRAVQTAVDMIHKGDTPQRVQSEFILIRSLVEQYKNGLDEVLIEFLPASASIEDHQVAVPEIIEPVSQEPLQSPVGDMIDSLNSQLQMGMSEDSMGASQAEDTPFSSDIETETVNNLSKAVQTVQPLIQFAPSERNRDALQALSQFHTLAAPKKAANGDVDSTTGAQKKVVEIESLMPELTNVALTSARHMGKNVSISYAVNDVRIGQDIAEPLSVALRDLMSILIRGSLEVPDVRRERGESGAGHLSIVSTLVQGKVKLEIQCTGRDIEPDDLEIASWSRLKALGVTVILGREIDRFKLVVEGLPDYELLDKPASAGSAFNLEQAS